MIQENIEPPYAERHVRVVWKGLVFSPYSIANLEEIYLIILFRLDFLKNKTSFI